MSETSKPTTNRGRILERYEYAGPRTCHSAQTFANWLGGWRDLRAQGWDVTVLDGGTHAIALALHLGPEHAAHGAQLSLLEEEGHSMTSDRGSTLKSAGIVAAEGERHASAPATAAVNAGVGPASPS